MSSFVEDTTDIDMKIENIIYHEIKPKKEPKKNKTKKCLVKKAKKKLYNMG